MKMPDVRREKIKDDGQGKDILNPYWEGNLNDVNKEFLNTWDHTSAHAKTFFENIDMFERDFDVAGEDINLSKFFDNHPKILNVLYDSFIAFMELERTDIVVSMIEAQEDEEGVES